MNLHGRARGLRALRPGVLLTHAHPEHPGVPGPDWETDVHEVHRWCRLLEYFGMPADPADLGLARPAQPSLAPGAIVVHPGCAFVARRWPAERYGFVARQLAKTGLPVVVTGNADQRQLALQVAAIAGLPQRSVLAGQTGLTQLAALIADASLVVCGDTGFSPGDRLQHPVGGAFRPGLTRHWGRPPQRPQHVALWAGSAGDTFADRPDPGLLQITTADGLDAAAIARRLSPVPPNALTFSAPILPD